MTMERIPVKLVGPGSQPLVGDDPQLTFIAMPTQMSSYLAPDIPEPEQVEHLQGAQAVTAWLHRALDEYRVGTDPWIADISALDAANRELVNQILGEGEVSLMFTAGVTVKMQESVLAGIWRTVYVGADGTILRDLIEVCDVPVLARRPPRPGADPAPDLASQAGEVMNALPIITELREALRNWRPGALAHVINLTLLPLSEADIALLDETLGGGPVATLSRGYGDCHITSTAWPGVWWVRYTNSMGTLILNTLEVTDVPAVTCAAQDDLNDTRRRFGELLEPYWQELA